MDPMKWIGWALVIVVVVLALLRDRRREHRAKLHHPSTNGVDRTEVEVQRDGPVRVTLSRTAPSPAEVKCQSCAAGATHPMPIIVNAERVDDSFMARLEVIFGGRQRTIPTGGRMVIDDEEQPNRFCAQHHRMALNLLEAKIADEQAAQARARAETSTAIALAEGGGLVALGRKLEQVIREDAEAEAEKHRRYPKERQLTGKPEEDRTN